MINPPLESIQELQELLVFINYKNNYFKEHYTKPMDNRDAKEIRELCKESKEEAEK